jgi:hypothetical protein
VESGFAPEFRQHFRFSGIEIVTVDAAGEAIADPAMKRGADELTADEDRAVLGRTSRGIAVFEMVEHPEAGSIVPNGIERSIAMHSSARSDAMDAVASVAEPSEGPGAVGLPELMEHGERPTGRDPEE